MTYDFVVLTAAITRPDLHTRVFKDHLWFIGESKVRWIINIDPVPGTVSLEETVRNCESVLGGRQNVELEILRGGEEGCFMSATKRLAERADQLLDETRFGVVWLEDDWVLTQPSRFERQLGRFRNVIACSRTKVSACEPGSLHEKTATLDSITKRGRQDWFVCLVPRTKVSLNPGIWSKALFTRAFTETFARLPSGVVDDPETLCADPCNEGEAADKIEFLIDPIYQDGGRAWAAEAGVIKWDKSQDEFQERGAVAYRSRSSHDSQHRNAAHSGYFVIPDIMFGSRLTWLAEVAVADGAVEMRPVGVPHLRFDIVFTQPSNAHVYMNKLHGWARTCPLMRSKAQIEWRTNADTGTREIIFDSPRGSFVADLNRRLPIRALWMLPLQGALGVGLYLAETARSLTRFDCG